MFKKYKFAINLLGSTLALLTPGILLTSCAKQAVNDQKEEEIPETFKDLKKEPFSVVVKKADLMNTELPGADTSDVDINVADNKLVLRKPFSQTDIQALKEFIASYENRKPYELYNFFFGATNQDARNDFKSVKNENQIFSSETKREEMVSETEKREITYKGLTIVINGIEYQSFNDLFTVKNNKLKVVEQNPPLNPNAVVFKSLDNQNEAIDFWPKDYTSSTESNESPISIDETNHSIIFNNLFLNKTLFTDNEKTDTAVNWTINVGTFTLLNAF
ncbi:hypothetical protein H3143_01985 [Mycoplasma tullyi]|uniref:Lipoprotein n=1 Tax=Mycoplasma tullyi TaxID=1612150 RepID=A0A7D7YDU6_9MOLU|nr:hypothetical protein [Mycoplasma tullyi]QMT98258.1 hypothetical protein H3143_01985 [Mycoplasma tullyi]